MTIRPLTASDAAAFQALRLYALRESPTAFGSSHEEECDRPLEAVAASLAPGSGRHLFGAFVEGDLVGMVGVGRESGRKELHRGFVRSMYVAPGHRGAGLGRQLLDAALAFAATLPGLRQLTLAVTAGNDAALALYEAAGFHVYGCAPEALQVDGVLYDELGMMKPLTPTGP